MRRFCTYSRVVFLVLGSILAFSAGCSRGSKGSGFVKKADQYFAAGDYDRAEIEYKNAIQQAGFDPRAVAQLGTIYLEQGRAARAAGFLLKAVELNPQDLDVRVKLAHLNLASNQPLEARDAANFVLERRPNDPEAPILLAESANQPRDLFDARARLQTLPPSGAVTAALGLLELKERKVKEAESLLEKARDQDPKSPLIRAGLGRIYWSRDDLERADKEFAAAADLCPPRSPIRLQYARFKLLTGKIEAAKQLLDDMIRKTPDFLPSYIVRASIASDEKKHEESVALLDKVLMRDGQHPDAMLMSAQERLALGDKEKAIATLERASALFPASPQVHHHLGTAYLANGDLVKAMNSLSQALKLAPGATGPLIALAQVHVRQGNYDAAISALKPLAQQNPPNNDVRLLLAEAYQKQGSLEEALTIYRQYAASSPKSAQAQLLIGSILSRQNKRADARKAFVSALELAPNSMPALDAIVNLDLAEKKYPAAKTQIQGFIDRNPREAAPQVMLAKIHVAESNRAAAETALLKAIELRPEISASYVMLAQLYVEDKQPAKAIANLKLAVSRNQKDAGPFLMLAVLQEGAKDFVAARENYEKVLALNPKNAEALNNLAFVLSEYTPEIDKALEIAQRAKEQMPDHPAPADTLGWVLYKKGQYARAAGILEDSAERMADVPEVQYHFGMVSYMMGNEATARTYLERSLALSKDFRGAEDARAALGVLAIDLAKDGEAARPKLEQRISRSAEDPAALSRLAILDERAGKPEKAIAAYEQLLKANPSNVNAALEAIRLYRARNDINRALDLAKATRKLVPADGKLGHLLGRMTFEQGEHAAAVGILQEASRRLEGNPEVLFDLAEAAFSIGQINVAVDALQEALQRPAGFARAAQARQYAELASALNEPARLEAAARTAETALQSNPKLAPALAVRGMSALQKGDTKAAATAFEAVLKAYPNFTPAKRQLVILYSSSREDSKRALEYAARAREAYPNDTELAKAFGIILYNEASYSRAASMLQESARSRTEDAELMYFLGMAQNQLKESAAAKKSLERALSQGLSGERAAEARRVISAAK